MAYPVDVGYTSKSGTYIPEVWSGKTLVKFYRTTIFGSIANTDYEGEISNNGDKVIIRTVPDITIRPHKIDEDLTVESPTGGTVELLIDKGFYYAFKVDDVEKLQSDLNYVTKWSSDAGEQMANTQDQLILSEIYADAATGNKGTTAGVVSGSYNLGEAGTPREVTKDTILDFIVDVGTCMDEQKLPDSDRHLSLPPVLTGLIKKSELRDASLTGDARSTLRNGIIGMIDHFTIHKSNNIEKVTDGSDTVYNCIANHISAVTFAAQMTKDETLRNPTQFGDIKRGLVVFGFETIKPEGMFHLYLKKG